MDYMDIEELLLDLIQKNDDIEIAEAQFDEMLHEDEELNLNFGEWCMSKGYNEKRALKMFYKEYLQREDNIWDSIFPNREEYDGYK